MNNNKAVVIFTIIFFLASALFLAYAENRQTDENFQKDWWVLYFENPSSDSTNFVIENHSQQSNFHWEVWVGDEKMQEADFTVPKGQKKGFMAGIQNPGNKKITIKVISGEEKKEIYKQFD